MSSATILPFKPKRMSEPKQAPSTDNIKFTQSLFNPKLYHTTHFSKQGEGFLQNCKFLDRKTVPQELELWDQETGERAVFRFVSTCEQDFGGGSTVEYAVFERVV